MSQSLIQLACDGLYKLNYRDINSNVTVMYYKCIESSENIITNCPCAALKGRQMLACFPLPSKSRDATPLKRQ